MAPAPTAQTMPRMAVRSRHEAPGTQWQPRRNFAWLVILVVGAVIWILGAVITATTEDEILVPTVLLVGSFLMPMSMVMFALTRETEDRLPDDKILLAFLLGGSVGVVVSAYVEVRLLPTAHGRFLTVGLIEELTKGLLVVTVAWRLKTRRPRSGMVLGATVGAGFASFESAGYAFNTLLQNQDEHEILDILQTEISRAVLAPFGHITWTALFAGALFAAARADGRFRLTWPLVGTTAGIIVLHGLWDSSYGFAILLAQGLHGDGWTFEWPNTAEWIGLPTGGELRLFQAIDTGLLVVNSLIGALWVVHNWRKYGRAPFVADARLPSGEPEAPTPARSE
ncbi:PrsW family intramembrane metalloprotease [Kribbella sp. NPDC050124]|uniref:PrsW family intramembrane metalloprotease n=1 Tax=Kribbella sp. NPDC050124 TaxID=3364114 RepID=UPI0037AEBCEB